MYQAYKKTQTAFANPRDTEYRLFAQITGRTHRQSGFAADGSTFDLGALAQSSAVVSARHRLFVGREPPRRCVARANHSLSLFVNRYTSKVMRERAAVKPLIDINRTIMEGLAVRAPSSAAGPAAVSEAI